VTEKKSIVCVGLDPRPELLPSVLTENAPPPAAAAAFCKAIIDAVADRVPAVKPNIAFFEALGTLGMMSYAEICQHAQAKGLLVIGDVKRGDIGSTAEAYAAGLLTGDASPAEHSLASHDSITLNAYLGSDGILPFIAAGREGGQGLWLLVKTSNPSSQELQELALADGGTVAEHMAGLVSAWGESERGSCGWSSVGAVVGATHGEQLARFRELMPHTPFLLPGYGAQGAGAEDIVGAFTEGGLGGVVNASRSIIFAYRQEDTVDFAGAAQAATDAMNADLNAALEAAGKGF
ncbi:MAG: orotidine-5'-phosphate decarboxylase, partial [Planctomycetota bacterium]